MQSVDVRTAQNVRIRYEAASIGDRIVAYILDTIMLVAVIFGISTILSSLETSLPVSISVVLFIPVMSYHLLCEVFLNGQSIGKMVLNIKVVKLDGSRPSLGAYLIRWLFRILEITLFTGVLALIVILINGKDLESLCEQWGHRPRHRRQYGVTDRLRGRVGGHARVSGPGQRRLSYLGDCL